MMGVVASYILMENHMTGATTSGFGLRQCEERRLTYPTKHDFPGACGVACEATGERQKRRDNNAERCDSRSVGSFWACNECLHVLPQRCGVFMQFKAKNELLETLCCYT